MHLMANSVYENKALNDLPFSLQRVHYAHNYIDFKIPKVNEKERTQPPNLKCKEHNQFFSELELGNEFVDFYGCSKPQLISGSALKRNINFGTEHCTFGFLKKPIILRVYEPKVKQFWSHSLFSKCFCNMPTAVVKVKDVSHLFMSIQDFIGSTNSVRICEDGHIDIIQ